MAKPIQLGDLVQDEVTLFKGIAIGRTRWIHGCDRITIKPQGVTKEGGEFDASTFDEPSIKILKRAVVKSENNDEPEPKKKPTARTGGMDIVPDTNKSMGKRD